MRVNLNRLINCPKFQQSVINTYPSMILKCKKIFKNTCIKEIFGSKEVFKKLTNQQICFLIRYSPECMKFVDNSFSNNFIRKLIRINHRSFKYLNDPSPGVIVYALKASPDNFKYVEFNKIPYEGIIWILRFKPELLLSLRQKQKYCWIVLKTDWRNLKYIKNPSRSMCLFAYKSAKSQSNNEYQIQQVLDLIPKKFIASIHLRDRLNKF